MKGTLLILHFLIVVLLASPLTMTFLILLHRSDFAAGSSSSPSAFHFIGQTLLGLPLTISVGAFVSIPAAIFLAVAFYALRRAASRLPASWNVALFLAFPLLGALAGILAAVAMDFGHTRELYLPAAMAGIIVGLLEGPVWRRYVPNVRKA